MISIIIPVYNAEKTLKECVDSILTQSYRNFELILVDDGSKDTSSKICDEYASQDNRIIVIHKQNGGVSSARNTGLNIVKGEWITFIDADDFITEGYFDGVEDATEDVLFKKYQWLRKEGILPGTVVTEKTNSSLTEFLSEYITDSIIRGPVFKFYRTDILGDLRFLPDMKIGEDAEFVFRYLAQCRTYCLLSRGEYIVRAAEEPDEVKYAISVDYAINSLHHLLDAYEELIKTHPLGRAPFTRYLAYFKRISKPEWHKKPSLWYRNEDILRFYKYTWKDLAWKQKVKYLFIRWFSR